ncbi:hypothetical protein GGS20DRAFT_575218 [Poronia punctata]|nr:hypothetical protein GGS20DRAFT_575218 [Poronia punctata]
MALQAIRNVVLLFSNPTWSNGHTVPSTILRNITALSSELAYSEDIYGNITTLTSNYVPTKKGTIQGLLYVPDLSQDDTCYELAKKYIPPNATRQADLPPTNYILIALAPWINVDCTQSFMAAAASDPVRAMLVYRPEDEDGQPPAAGSDAWELNDGGRWRHRLHFPVYAISSLSGDHMMRQLSFYSGDLTQVPFATEINATYSPNPADYIRVWTQLSVSPGHASLAIWAFVLIILGVLLGVISGTSLLMHYVQNRRRALLRRRVMDGEVNLEALGIKRLTVPLSHIQSFPLFTYNYNPPNSTAMVGTRPVSSTSQTTLDLGRNAPGRSRGQYDDRLDYQPDCQICLHAFESKVTIIRELSCGHIFHPQCIDSFLSEMSSLCPLCKTSMYPRGYCPKITNSMVRRELGTRRLRSRGLSRTSFTGGWRRVRSENKRSSSQPTSIPLTPDAGITIHMQTQPSPGRSDTKTSGRETVTTRERMEELVLPIDESSSDDGRPRWKRAALTMFPGFH